MRGYNFTERVRTVLAMAREEALHLRHEYVGTEHLLLGIIREGQGLAVSVLHELAVDPHELRKAVLGGIAMGQSDSFAKDLPYTSRAKKVVELSMAEARGMSHSYVGTEHVLLGLLAEEKGIAAQVLHRAGVTLEKARLATLRQLGSPAPGADRLGASGVAGKEVGGAEPRRIVVELHFDDGSTKRRECRDRREAMGFLMTQ